MQQITIDANIKSLNPKAFVLSHGGAETLFSYGQPVVHKNAEGRVHVDAITWNRSKSTAGHVIQYMGMTREEITNELLLGHYELCRLIAPNVDVKVPTPRIKDEDTSEASG